MKHTVVLHGIEGNESIWLLYQKNNWKSILGLDKAVMVWYGGVSK